MYAKRVVLQGAISVTTIAMTNDFLLFLELTKSIIKKSKSVLGITSLNTLGQQRKNPTSLV